jgi:hypothetical protein
MRTLSDSPAKLARSTHPSSANGAEEVGLGLPVGVGSVLVPKLADPAGVGVVPTGPEASEVSRGSDPLGDEEAEEMAPDVADAAADGRTVVTSEAHPATSPTTSKTLRCLRTEPPHVEDPSSPTVRLSPPPGIGGRGVGHEVARSLSVNYPS